MSDHQFQPEQSFVVHLLELRRCLIWILAVMLACFIIMVPFSQKIYTFVAHPLMAVLPVGNHMIATDVIAPFFVPIKVTLMAAFLITLPHTLYQVWSFVAPGLYRHEKRMILPLLISSVLLFVLGMVFAYVVVFPIVFRFLTQVTPQGVNMATDIDKYLSFILGMFVAFGLSFEVPVLVVLLHRMGLVSLAQLKKARAYIVVAAFVVAAIVTPPDVISQTLLAVPLLILYEAGILMCRLFDSKSTHVSNID